MEKIHKLSRNNLEVILTAPPVKITCESCEFLARDKEDLISIKREGVCTECLINFKHCMKDAWEHGQRPTREDARNRMNILIEEVK